MGGISYPLRFTYLVVLFDFKQLLWIFISILYSLPIGLQLSW